MSQLSDLRNQIISGSIILKYITCHEDVKRIGYGAVRVAYVQYMVFYGGEVSLSYVQPIYIYSIFCLRDDVEIERHSLSITRLPPPLLTKVLREVSLSLMLFALLDTSVPL